jgi:hypothetical protein
VCKISSRWKRGWKEKKETRSKREGRRRKNQLGEEGGGNFFDAVGTTAKEGYFDSHDSVGARVRVLGAGISPAISSLSSSTGEVKGSILLFE